MFQGTVERVTKELTALAPSTIKFPVALHQSECSWDGLDKLSCFPQHISACLDAYPFSIALSANSVESPTRSLFYCVTDIRCFAYHPWSSKPVCRQKTEFDEMMATKNPLQVPTGFHTVSTEVRLDWVLSSCLLRIIMCLRVALFRHSWPRAELFSFTNLPMSTTMSVL